MRASIGRPRPAGLARLPASPAPPPAACPTRGCWSHRRRRRVQPSYQCRSHHRARVRFRTARCSPSLRTAAAPRRRLRAARLSLAPRPSAQSTAARQVVRLWATESVCVCTCVRVCVCVCVCVLSIAHLSRAKCPLLGRATQQLAHTRAGQLARIGHPLLRAIADAAGAPRLVYSLDLIGFVLFGQERHFLSINCLHF
jgi:hypothetical protein